MLNSETMLKVEHVIKRFGGFTAVDGVSLEARMGEFVTLLGPSGCGKTTLLKMIAGFYPLEEGNIYMGGVKVNKFPPEKRDSVMCFQSYALFPHLSVGDNVAFGLVQHRVPKSERRERTRAVLKQVDLLDQIAKYPEQLSGGQQQRVALARALVMQPRLVLFDEPLSNLDAKLREHIRLEIRALQQQFGFTAIYVTHDQDEALAMSDRILVMRQGKVQQEGPPRSIYQQPNSDFVADFVGLANILPAQVRPLGEGYYCAQTPIGEIFAQPAVPPPSIDCRLGWRPESVHLLSDDDSPADNQIEVVIVQLAFLGESLRLLARHPQWDKLIQVTLPPIAKVAQGQRCRLTIQQEGVFFLTAVADQSEPAKELLHEE